MAMVSSSISRPNNNKQGKRRVKIARLEKENDMYAAFSKRRHGIYKKASELCTYCNVELAIILFSPGMRPYSFGHPSSETIINRFLSQRQKNPNLGFGPGGAGYSNNNNLVIPGDDNQCIYSQKEAEIQELNEKLDGILNQMTAEKKLLELMKKKAKEEEGIYWWKRPVAKIDDTKQLQALKDALSKLKLYVIRQATKADRSILSNIVNYSKLVNNAASPGVLMFANYYSNLLKPNIIPVGNPTEVERRFNPPAFPSIDSTNYYNGTGSGYDLNFENNNPRFGNQQRNRHF